MCRNVASNLNRKSLNVHFDTGMLTALYTPKKCPRERKHLSCGCACVYHMHFAFVSLQHYQNDILLLLLESLLPCRWAQLLKEVWCYEIMCQTEVDGLPCSETLNPDNMPTMHNMTINISPSRYDILFNLVPEDKASLKSHRRKSMVPSFSFWFWVQK